MEQSFSKVVDSIVKRVKITRGGVKKLEEVTGKASGRISQWRQGNSIPSLEDQVNFIEAANRLIEELESEHKRYEQRLKELSSNLFVQ